MTRKLIVSPSARVDLEEALAWFRERSPDLPGRFGMEIESIYSSILEHPEMYPLIYKNFRRALLNRFPYSVFYVIEPQAVLIVGVVHQARDESTWKKRS
ncbi:MAG TPA: type II toxin-antitoxin system RelE/ParE family toxin [Thermoanaerobaculia bacterium]